MESNMNENKKENIKEVTIDTVEVPRELIINLKGIIEVVNERINWKTSELLPVGLICKQLDDIINEQKKE
jgi:hypothetical protein